MSVQSQATTAVERRRAIVERRTRMAQKRTGAGGSRSAGWSMVASSSGAAGHRIVAAGEPPDCQAVDKPTDKRPTGP
jgi:hypothetical protein